jgi:hypothetical protein
MKTLKKLAGVLTFFAVFCLSVAVTRYFYIPFKAASNVSVVEPSSALVFVPQTDSGLGTYEVRLVSLDFQSRKSYTTLTLNRAPRRPAPERLWVRTYFFTPDGSRAALYTDTVELHDPFQDGDTVTLTAAAPCHQCDQAPAKDGYYARVQVSTRSGNDLLPRDVLIDDDIATATPVLVQNDRDSSSSRATR